jgi:hypothetical protein
MLRGVPKAVIEPKLPLPSSFILTEITEEVNGSWLNILLPAAVSVSKSAGVPETVVIVLDMFYSLLAFASCIKRLLLKKFIYSYII